MNLARLWRGMPRGIRFSILPTKTLRLGQRQTGHIEAPLLFKNTKAFARCSVLDQELPRESAMQLLILWLRSTRPRSLLHRTTHLRNTRLRGLLRNLLPECLTEKQTFPPTDMKSWKIRLCPFWMAGMIFFWSGIFIECVLKHQVQPPGIVPTLTNDWLI